MWFRRDLRVEDNAALHHALKSCCKVFCVFVFDRDILDLLPSADRRVEFIRESLVDLDGQLHRVEPQVWAQVQQHIFQPGRVSNRRHPLF